MLYEALTGRRPFVGPPQAVLAAKQRQDPPRPHAPGVPADLADLCTALLARDPARRPVVASTSSGGAEGGPLIGRVAELDVLERAFAAGGTAVAIVRGPSGIGKSRLVRAFLETLRGRALVLAGRCYERESVPFKAVDSLMDALCTYLLSLPHGTLATLLPDDAPALIRLFPALGRIGAIGRAATQPGAPDPQELRARAFAALRELARRLAARAPLVIHIDDLQWGDADSGALLDALLAPPDPPRLLFVGCHRADDVARRPVLRALAARRPGVALHDVALGPLSSDEARELAGRLFDDIDAAVLEAGGNPFFLVRGQVALAELPADARTLLAAIALAAEPIPQAVAIAAAELPTDVGLAELERLRAARLVRTEGAKGRDAVECYHDRIRDAAAALTDPELRRRLHRQLARALERDPTQAESLAEHFQEAGVPAEAARWAAVAAERAAAALAFDRAAELYRRALAWEPRRELHAGLGDALVAVGRGEEAARAYLEAARGAPAAASLAHRHRAAEQLMHTGHTDEGAAVLRDVLRELGLPALSTRAAVLASLAVDRAALAVRGHGYRERRADRIPAADLLRVDACWSAMTGFTLISAVRPFAFQARYVRLALRAGEPSRVAVAFASEAFVYGHDDARAAELTARAHELAERTGDPAVRATVMVFGGWRDILIGDWPAAEATFATAAQILREECTGHTWARDTAAIFGGLAILHQGRFGDLRRHVTRMLRDARVRGDRYLSDAVPYHLFLSDLAADDPDALRDAVAAATADGLPAELGVPHWGAVAAEACCAIYEGRARAALPQVEAIWPGLERSLLLRSAAFRREALTVRARVHLAALGAGGSEAVVVAMIRALARDRTPPTRAISVLLDACLHPTVERFTAAAAALDRHHMTALAAAARWRLGELSGGSPDAAFDAVRKPDRFVALLAPVSRNPRPPLPSR